MSIYNLIYKITVCCYTLFFYIDLNMKKVILVFLMLLGNINACVDEQILAWEKVYDSFHTGQANWKETHVPELFDRIDYMAEYVKKAIKDSPERLNSLETILIEPSAKFQTR